MAKGKNLNPADALRKAQRKKELKKNKAERQKTRDFALVKKDTIELEDEIAELEKIVEPTNTQRSRLTELKTELSKIEKKKEEYVEAHPEARGLVYKRRRDKEKEATEEADRKAQLPGKTKRNLFNKKGLPRHPERSVYYDPVMNPYGMPPPGMPYVERALLPGEVDSEAEEEDDKGASDSDDDIPMPQGPPPGAPDGDGGESDDDIPLPEGPPPGEEQDSVNPPLPSGPPPSMPNFPPTIPPSIAPVLLLAAFGAAMTSQPLPPPPFFPLPPQLPASLLYPPTNLPPPPPGFFPRRGQSLSAVQDPLSNVPHQTYQAHRAAHSNPTSLPVNPNLPAKPVGVAPNPSTSAPLPKADVNVASANATISAEPQLRNFKKESTAFVPAALKRKKAGGAGRINAAPSVVGSSGNASEAGAAEGGNGGDGTATLVPKPDLLGSLREMLGPMVKGSGTAVIEADGDDATKAKKRKVEKPKDDYDKFLDEMGGILGAPPQ